MFKDIFEIRSFLPSHFVFTELKLSNSSKVIEINECQLLASTPIWKQDVEVIMTLNGFPRKLEEHPNSNY